MTIERTGSIVPPDSPRSDGESSPFIGKLESKTVTNLSHPSYASTNCFKVAMTVKAVALVALAVVGTLFALGLIANPIGAIALGAIGGVFLTALIVNIAMKCLHQKDLGANSEAPKLYTLLPSERTTEITAAERAQISAKMESLKDQALAVEAYCSGARVEGQKIFMEFGELCRGSASDDVGLKKTNLPGLENIEVPQIFIADAISRPNYAKISLGGAEYSIHQEGINAKKDLDSVANFYRAAQNWVDENFSELDADKKKAVFLCILDTMTQKIKARAEQAFIGTIGVLIMTPILDVDLPRIKANPAVFSFSKDDDGNLICDVKSKSQCFEKDDKASTAKELVNYEAEYKLKFSDFKYDEKEAGGEKELSAPWTETVVGMKGIEVTLTDRYFELFPE